MEFLFLCRLVLFLYDRHMSLYVAETRVVLKYQCTSLHRHCWFQYFGLLLLDISQLDQIYFKITMHPYIGRVQLHIVVQQHPWNYVASTTPCPLDANIIECWLLLKTQLKKRVHRINSVQDIEHEIQSIMTRISLVYIRNLYSSLPRRMQRIIATNGHITKY